MIAVFVIVPIFIGLRLGWWRWPRNYSFIISEMMFMADDSYRLPLRKRLHAMWLSFGDHPEI